MEITEENGVLKPSFCSDDLNNITSADSLSIELANNNFDINIKGSNVTLMAPMLELCTSNICFSRNNEDQLDAPNYRNKSQFLKRLHVPLHPVPSLLKELPPLIPFQDIVINKYIGPLPESNWVIPGKLIMGAYPATCDDRSTYINLAKILRLGVGVFVCLQEEYFPNLTEHEWRSRNLLRPYFWDVQRIFDDGSLWSKPVHIKPRSVEFIHLPIKDMTTSASDQDIFNLCIQIIDKLRNGDKIYLHCWGGHGRSGIICSVLLSLLYQLNPELSMRYVQSFHDCRMMNLGVSSPQTTEQRNQVIRIVQSNYFEDYIQSIRPIDDFHRSKIINSSVKLPDVQKLKKMKFD